jgi:hypothetical protein
LTWSNADNVVVVPLGDVHGDAGDVVFSEFDLAGVESGSNLEGPSGSPRCGCT